MYRMYSPIQFIIRRTVVAVLTVLLLPVIWMAPKGGKVASRLHRAWLKRGEQPVWQAESEKAPGNSILF